MRATRRPTFGDEAMSRLAAWSGRFAMFALAVAALSVVIVRSGLLEVTPALATFAAALVFAGLAVLLAFASFVSIWRRGLTGLGRATLGLFIGLIMLAYPGYLSYRATTLPQINDVTTDLTNPPRFEALARSRPPGHVGYPANTAALQRAGYPDIVSLQLNVPLNTAYAVTSTIITKRRWLIADQRPPGAARREGNIEATARTAIMGFRDDIAIRITPMGQGGQGSRVDIRSASRVGQHDFGANASRVRSLMEDIEEAANNAPEPKPEPEPKAPVKKKQPEKRR